MLRPLFALLFNRYLWLLVMPLVIGWLLLASRMETRTYHAAYQQSQRVKQIWGGNLAQPMPSVRYKRSGSDVAALSRGELTATDIQVTLTMDYRKKGLIYYTGYNAAFSGTYQVHNPENEKIYLSFIFPYPTRQAEGMLQNVKLLIDGKEDTADTEYQPTLALWTGTLEPAQTIAISVHYQGRGLSQFLYGFETGKPINKFTGQITVQGAQDLDYPVATMPTTEPPTLTPEGKILRWKLDRSLTQLNIGVILPDRLNIENQLFVMSYRAPVFFVMFLLSFALILHLAGKTLHFIPVAVMSFTYFLFYPLFAYLLMYIDLTLAFLMSFFIIGLLLFNYARLLHGLTVAWGVALSYSFYLGITSVAALLPTYTGLILTLEGIALMAILMQILARHRDLHLSEVLAVFNTPSAPPAPKAPVPPIQS